MNETIVLLIMISPIAGVCIYNAITMCEALKNER